MEATIPADRSREIQRRLPGLTGGEGNLESPWPAISRSEESHRNVPGLQAELDRRDPTPLRDGQGPCRPHRGDRRPRHIAACPSPGGAVFRRRGRPGRAFLGLPLALPLQTSRHRPSSPEPHPDADVGLAQGGGNAAFARFGAKLCPCVRPDCCHWPPWRSQDPRAARDGLLVRRRGRVPGRTGSCVWRPRARSAGMTRNGPIPRRDGRLPSDRF